MSRGNRAFRIDASQPPIVKALEAQGWSVFSTAVCGRGFPDLCVGVEKLNVLLEVKRPGPPSAQSLTPKEREFQSAWRGQVVTVWTPGQAVEAVRACLAARPKRDE